jgi:hypothetical protein
MVQECAGGPLVILPGVMEASFALGKGDGLVDHRLRRMDEFGCCVGVHLFEFSSTGTWHGRKFSRSEVS